MMPVSVEIRRGTARFLTRGDGYVTRHSFSFGAHYDPDNVGFGPLVVHDDHLLKAGCGFDDHRHRDAEIVTWVLIGALDHRDAGGGSGDPGVGAGVGAGAGAGAGAGRRVTVHPGEVQVQSAGSGITHAEVAAPGGPVRFVQAWLTPDEPGGEPSYAVAPVLLPQGELVVVASGHRDAPARLGVRAATFLVARLGPGDTVTLPDEPRQHVFVGAGALARSSLAEPLSDGDAFRIVDQPGLELTAAVPTELLVWSFR
jgi:redox-sensitive bicupin YhaK (pirin superfamily)